MLVKLKAGTLQYQLLSYMLKHPKGATFADIGKDTGLTEVQIKRVIRFIKTYDGASIKKSATMLRMSIPTQMELLAGSAASGTSVTGSEPATVATNNVADSGEGTKVVWPAAPSVLNVKDKFGFYYRPDYFKRFQRRVEGGSHISFSGPPGIGKSVTVEYLAALQGLPLVNINADAGLRARSLIGGMTDLGRFEVAQFAAAVVFGWWAKLDEVNAADPDAILALNGLVAAPNMITVNGKSYPVHKDFRLFVTYNPGLIGTKPLPESFKDRFYPIKLPFPRKEQLKKMLIANGVDENAPWLENMLEFAVRVSQQRTEGKHKFDITLRRLTSANADCIDGASTYDALYYSCIDRIDAMLDAKAVKDILDGLKAEVVQKGGVL